MKFGRDDYDRQKTLDAVPEDEPVFLLRAHDEAAIEAVRNYAHRLRVSGVSSEIYESVWLQADRMEAWIQKNSPGLSQKDHSEQQSEDGEKDTDFLNMG